MAGFAISSAHLLDLLPVTSTTECWGSGQKVPLMLRAKRPGGPLTGWKWLVLALHRSWPCLTSAGSSECQKKRERGEKSELKSIRAKIDSYSLTPYAGGLRSIFQPDCPASINPFFTVISAASCSLPLPPFPTSLFTSQCFTPCPSFSSSALPLAILPPFCLISQ